MKISFRLALFFAAPAFGLAVYAPIPEQEQGKALTYRLGAAVIHDSNIFGAATGEIDSMVYNINGGITFNGSVSDQTFASASYDINNDHVVDRPGKKDLTNQNLLARLAHSFSSATNLDVSGEYDITENPESPLNGVLLTTNQSNKRGELDARYTTTAGEKLGVVVKYRYINYSYDDDTLGDELDRNENLAGLEVSYALLPQTKLVGEYRYQSIDYSSGGNLKDKKSNYLMAGADYNPGKDLQLSARVGFEDRNRSSASDTTVPYVQLSSHYNYAAGSFVAAGYEYTLEEPSDVVNYSDEKVNRFFVNVQHRLTPAFTASGSITYEPSQLQGLGAHRNDDETTTRFGLGLAWQPNKNWTVSGNYDLDDINSDVASRNQNRNRFGISARVTF